jgi:hypothetical protein
MSSIKRPQLPTIDQITFDLDKFEITRKVDNELKESLNLKNKDQKMNKIIDNYHKAKNYVQIVDEIQNFYSLLTNNTQLETLLKNINNLKYYIDILKNLSNLSK